MKALYLFNLFFVCCNSFIIQPSYLPIKYKYSNNNMIKNNNLIEFRKQLIINLNKNNNEDENEIYKIKLIINFVYNIILYTYIIIHLYK
jgi:hypothetical protein